MLHSGNGFKNYYQREKGFQNLVDESLVKVGSEYVWLWIVIEPENRQILALFLTNKSKERNMLITERFLSVVVKIHGKYPLSTDGGTWYLQACRFLVLEHIFIPVWRKA